MKIKISIEKIWISSPSWQRMMLDCRHHDRRACNHINRPIFVAPHHRQIYILFLPVSPLSAAGWLFCLLVLLRVSGCCGCYCLLRLAVWPVDCSSTSGFLLSPLLLCHCRVNMLCRTCGCKQLSIKEGLRKCVCWQHHHLDSVVNSVVNSIVVGTIDRRQTFFSWHVQFFSISPVRTISR